jgi:type I restriction enzyme S subunit
LIEPQKIKLGELVYVLTKGTTPTSIGEKFVDKGIPFLRINNFKDGQIQYDNVLYIKKDVHENALRRSKIFPGDFLITIAGTIGKTLIVPKDAQEMNCNQAVAILRLKSSIHKGYLQYWFNTKDASNQISNSKVTATISNLSLGQIKELRVPLPTLEVQKHISAILDKANNIRRKRHQAIEHADEFLRAVFLDMFGDPVLNPKKWGKEKIGDLMGMSSGKSLTAKEMAVNGDYEVYGGNGINGMHDEFMFENEQLVIGRVGVYCGAIHITSPKCWVTDNALYIKTYKKPFNLHFMAELLKLVNLNQYSGKAAQPLISGSRVYPLEVIFPPLEIQNDFERKKKSFLGFLSKYERSKNDMESLFSSISQKAFSGEL